MAAQGGDPRRFHPSRTAAHHCHVQALAARLPGRVVPIINHGIDAVLLLEVIEHLPPDEAVREAFSQSVLGRRPGSLQRYWTEQYFHGISPPFVVRSPEAMLRFVAETPGAVGYLALCQVDKRVQVVARLPVPPELASRVRHVCEAP